MKERVLGEGEYLVRDDTLYERAVVDELGTTRVTLLGETVVRDDDVSGVEYGRGAGAGAGADNTLRSTVVVL